MGVETVELIHEDDDQTRRLVGKAKVAKTAEGKLTLRMMLDPNFVYLRPLFRQRIEDYLGTISPYRARTFGDHYS